MKQLAQKIKTIAKLHKIPIRRIEQDLDLSNGSIAKWGTSSNPSISKVLKVAEYLHVDISDLLSDNVSVDSIVKEKNIADIVYRLNSLSSQDLEFIRTVLDRLEK